MVFTHMQFRGGKRLVNTKKLCGQNVDLITILFEFISWNFDENSELKGAFMTKDEDWKDFLLNF